MLGRLGLIDPTKTSMNTVLRALSTVTDVMLQDDEQASVTGYVMIGDSTYMSVSHVAAFTPSLAKKAMVVWQVRGVDHNAASLYDVYQVEAWELGHFCTSVPLSRSPNVP